MTDLIERVARLCAEGAGDDFDAFGQYWAETHYAETARQIIAALTPPAAEGEVTDGIEAFQHDDARELGLLYNHYHDDRVQFTRHNMLVAIAHGRRLAHAAPKVAGVEEAARALYEHWIAENIEDDWMGWERLPGKETWRSRARAALSAAAPSAPGSGEG